MKYRKYGVLPYWTDIEFRRAKRFQQKKKSKDDPPPPRVGEMVPGLYRDQLLGGSSSRIYGFT